MSARSHWRAVDKLGKAIGHGGVTDMVNNIDAKFPGYKDARDILEHFEDYAVGEGKLQKAGQHLGGPQVTVVLGDGRAQAVQVLGLEPIQLSLLAWLTDHANFVAEALVHDYLNPGEEWKGFWPMYGYEAPPDWKTHDWHLEYPQDVARRAAAAQDDGAVGG